MKVETLERALHSWPQWKESIDRSRGKLVYEPTFGEQERMAWWETYGGGQLQEECERALTRLLMPKSFGRYWMACLISDYPHPGPPQLENIRVPTGWIGKLRRPVDPVPKGCLRIEVSFIRCYKRGRRITNFDDADEVRLFPPPLVVVNIPKWLHAEGRRTATLSVDVLPRKGWKKLWQDHTRLPILTEAPAQTQFHVSIGMSREKEATLRGWRAFTTIEVPPWGISDDTVKLAREQLVAVRMWYETQKMHPLSTYLRSAAASSGATQTIDPPGQWPTWLCQYQVGEISYQDLVERVYWSLTEGSLPLDPPHQPPNAKTAADRVRRRFNSAGLDRPRLLRNWWRYINYRGPQGQ